MTIMRRLVPLVVLDAVGSVSYQLRDADVLRQILDSVKARASGALTAISEVRTWVFGIFSATQYLFSHSMQPHEIRVVSVQELVQISLAILKSGAILWWGTSWGQQRETSDIYRFRCGTDEENQNPTELQVFPLSPSCCRPLIDIHVIDWTLDYHCGKDKKLLWGIQPGPYDPKGDDTT